LCDKELDIFITREKWVKKGTRDDQNRSMVYWNFLLLTQHAPISMYYGLSALAFRSLWCGRYVLHSATQNTFAHGQACAIHAVQYLEPKDIACLTRRACKGSLQITPSAPFFTALGHSTHNPCCNAHLMGASQGSLGAACKLVPLNRLRDNSSIIQALGAEPPKAKISL